MPFKSVSQLKQFLSPTIYKCRESHCVYKTTEEEEYARHAIEHSLIKEEEEKQKKIINTAKPKKELSNMLNKILE